MRDVRWLICAVVCSVLVFDGECIKDSFQECFEKDSISCIQMQLFQHARDLLSQPSIDLLGGMSLVRETIIKNNTEAGRSANDQHLGLQILEESVENATDIVSRQEAIENFLVRKARDIVVERTIRWDLGQTIRNLLNAIPNVFKAKLTNYVTEARAKGKKFMKVLVPLLVGLKLKMAGMAAMTYLGIAFLAKKAILAALVSLLVSGFLGLKKLITLQPAPHDDMAPYPTPYYPVPLWTPQYNGYDPHGHAEATQKLAYGAYKTS